MVAVLASKPAFADLLIPPSPALAGDKGRE